MTPFSWKQAIGFAIGVLRISPAQFWSMTPRELGYAIEAATGRSAPIDRAVLTELMKRFPDEHHL
jgi:uncharacterized phage protein (TIGR02216 family)